MGGLTQIQKDFSGNPIKGEALRELLKDLKRELSNSRIMASGMDDLSIQLVDRK